MALIPCPECGRMVSPNAEECPNCGAPVEQLLNGNASIVPEEHLTSIDKSEDTCSHTQEVTNNQQKDNPICNPSHYNEQKIEKKNGLLWILIALSVITLAIGSFVFLHNGNGSSSKQTCSEKNSKLYDKDFQSNTDDYIYNTHILTEEDFLGKGKSELRIMRNEIYARHGYIFKSEDLHDYFSRKPWYIGVTNDARKIQLNAIEKRNVEIILRHE